MFDSHVCDGMVIHTSDIQEEELYKSLGIYKPLYSLVEEKVGSLFWNATKAGSAG